MKFVRRPWWSTQQPEGVDIPGYGFGGIQSYIAQKPFGQPFFERACNLSVLDFDQRLKRFFIEFIQDMIAGKVWTNR